MFNKDRAGGAAQLCNSDLDSDVSRYVIFYITFTLTYLGWLAMKLCFLYYCLIPTYNEQ